MMLLFAVAVLLLLSGFESYYRNHWWQSVRLDLQFGESHVYAGDKVILTEVLENRKKLPLPLVEAAFRIPKGIWFTDAENLIISDYNYKRDVFSLRGMESVTRRYEIDCRRRGIYPISQVKAEAGSLFYKERYLMEQSEDEWNGSCDSLFVYAARTDVSSLVRLCDSVFGERESRSTYMEDPFSFRSIRDYTTRDPMKNINWKASAKTGSLMVNTFTSVQAEEFRILLDIEDKNVIRQEEEVENGISIAASLCRQLIRAGHPAGLMVNTDPVSVFLPVGGRSRLQEIEQFLTTDFTKTETKDFVTMASESVTREPGLKASKGAAQPVYILVSKNWREEDSGRFMQISGKECRVLVVIPGAIPGEYRTVVIQ